MRLWQALLMAGLSMLVGRVLLGKDIPLRSEGLQDAVTDLVLLAGYVNFATWMLSGAVVALVWAVRVLAPGLARSRTRYDATNAELFRAYSGFWTHWYDDRGRRYFAAKTKAMWRLWPDWLVPAVDSVPIVVGCLVLFPPLSEVIAWVGVVGIMLVLGHLWKHQRFPV